MFSDTALLRVVDGCVQLTFRIAKRRATFGFRCGNAMTEKISMIMITGIIAITMSAVILTTNTLTNRLSMCGPSLSS